MQDNFLWLSILFIIHDFEEIIVVPTWIKKNMNIISGMKRPMFGGVKSSSILSIGVLEEFILLISITSYTQYVEDNNLYFCLFLVYFIHLLIHIAVSVLKNMYIPGVLTAIVQIPCCIFLMKVVYSNVTMGMINLIFLLIFCFTILVLNLIFIHKLMGVIQNKEKLL